MRLLADVHISPRTVKFLRSLGHDVVRVSEALRPTASDQEIIDNALDDGRVVLTQDLDFSAVVALSGRSAPSIVSLRLTSSRIENVNSRLAVAIPLIESDLREGAIVAVEDERIRTRRLPIDPD